jgi:hypothetical protein
MGILEIKYSVNNSHFHYEMVNGCNNPTGVYAWFHHLLSSFILGQTYYLFTVAMDL